MSQDHRLPRPLRTQKTYQDGRRTQDPKTELARLFEAEQCPNLAVIIRTTEIRVTNPAAYINALKPYKDFINSVEHSIATVVDERNYHQSRSEIAEANFQTIASERDSLKQVIEGLSRAPVDTSDPMDLSAAQYNSSRLSQEVLDHRRAAGLCLACGEPGHMKSAHRWDPQANPYPLPMPQRTPQPRSFRGNSRGRENFVPSFRGRRGFGGSNPPFQPRPQGYQPQTSWTAPAHQLRATDYETGQVIGEVQSDYTPTESDSASQASHNLSRVPTPVLSRVSTPVLMQSKDLPLR